MLTVVFIKYGWFAVLRYHYFQGSAGKDDIWQICLLAAGDRLCYNGASGDKSRSEIPRNSKIVETGD